MVLLNVLVSSKHDKSNLVLSGSATISWLFEPSGPCSSDLWWRILSKHLETMWRKKRVLLGDCSVHKRYRSYSDDSSPFKKRRVFYTDQPQH